VNTVMVVCEGETEQAFVRQVLRPTLTSKNIHAESMNVKGGHYERYRSDIQEALRWKPHFSVVTSMIDYYGMSRRFPGWKAPTAAKGDPYPRVERLEEAFAKDIGDERFLPNLVLHEYEGLLFASPESIAHVVGQGKGQSRVQKILNEAHGNPEGINERPEKNPAKRLKGIYDNYNKVIHGPRIAAHIGLENLRTRCRHFAAWLAKIEERAASEEA
jgi:Domain of unknown function (DUF4276)